MKKSIITLFCLLFTFIAAVQLTACGSENGQSVTTTTTAATTASSATASSETSATTAEADVSNYFPFTKDVYKKFRGIGNEYAEFESYVDYSVDNAVQIRNVNPGTTSVSVYLIENGDLKRVFFEGETYFRHNLTHFRNREEIIIKSPVREGTEWTAENGTTRTITGLDIEITVPAGTYKALEITTYYTDSTVKDYYVRDIGLVKTEFTSLEVPDSKVTSELENISYDIPFIQNVSLYFADYANSETLIDTRAFTMFTGDDPKELFEAGLKDVPAGTDLVSMISVNTSILSIDPVSATDMVIIDFSNELISEMNAGAGFESMILSSLAKTFGYYYQKNKVIITVGGYPYSSGHIEFGEGEYIDLSTLGD